MLTDIVVGATITALLLAMALQVHKHRGSLAPQDLRPLDREGLRHKFMLLTKAHPEADMARLFDRLQQIETEPALDWLSV